MKTHDSGIALAMVLLVACGESAGTTNNASVSADSGTDAAVEDTRAEPKDLSASLERVRGEYDLPSLAGAIVEGDELSGLGATGIRRIGSASRVTPDDPYHLGADTKAMTAVLVATFIKDGKLAFETTLGAVFKEIGPDSKWNKVTVQMLLQHRGGVASNEPANKSWNDVWALSRGSEAIVSKRATFASWHFATAPLSSPGTKYLYSNAGYTILGSICERLGGRSWEELLNERVLQPLGMEGVGFGPTGNATDVKAPWPHVGDQKPVADKQTDNPEVIWPSGAAHMPMRAWGVFAKEVLRGLKSKSTFLPSDVWETLLTPAFGGDYAGGWIASGDEYEHSGSNTANYARIVLLPKENRAVFAATNWGSDRARDGTDAAINLLRTER